MAWFSFDVAIFYTVLQGVAIVMAGLCFKHIKVMIQVLAFKARKKNPVVVWIRGKDNTSNIHVVKRDAPSFEVNNSRYNFGQLSKFYRNSRYFFTTESLYDEDNPEPLDLEFYKDYQKTFVQDEPVKDEKGNIQYNEKTNMPIMERVKFIPQLLKRIDPLTYDQEFRRGVLLGKMEGQRNEKIIAIIAAIGMVLAGLAAWKVYSLQGQVAAQGNLLLAMQATLDSFKPILLKGV